MERHRFEILVEAASRGDASIGARSLADHLREVQGVLEADRVKEDPQSLDLGATVEVIASSGATVALAQGIAAWLRTRRAASIRIKRNQHSGSIEAEVRGIDPQAAIRIIELVSRD